MVSKKGPLRARSEDDKALRRSALLSAARALFDAHPYAEVKIADVARRARLAKGTVFLYFPTKEALFLDLLEELLGEWLDRIDEGLAATRATDRVSAVSALFVETLAARDTLTRLLTILHTILEQNVDLERVVRFKRFLLVRLGRTGASLEHALPGLAQGEGARLLLRIHAVVIGLRQTADAPPVVAEALGRPELAPLVVDFDVELSIVLRALLAGLAPHSIPKKTPTSRRKER